MPPSWEIIDVDKNKKVHSWTIVFRETDGANHRDYKITLSGDSTMADFEKELKKQAKEARKIRNKINAIKASFNSDQFEAFINS
jgi:hypothetical protein